LRRAKNLVQNVLGIGAELQRRAAKHHEIRRRAIHPGTVANGATNFFDPLRRLLRPAVGQRHLAGQPAQPDAPGIATQGLLHRSIGLAITAHRQQCADEQH
jgi:hypothetical protein